MELLELNEFKRLRKAGAIPNVEYRRYLLDWDNPVFDPGSPAPVATSHRAAIAKAGELAEAGLQGPALRDRLMGITLEPDDDDQGEAITPQEAGELALAAYQAGRYDSLKTALLAVNE